jgi:FG-GAP-like repeat/FG-GAP repeat
VRRRSLVSVVRCATAVALLTAPALAALPADAAVAATRVDFNKDGYPDLAVSAPQATVSGQYRAGYVAVVYGSASGPDTAHRQVVSRATTGVPGSPLADAWFGYTTVARDLDGDGYTDLAVGAGGYEDASVTVLWGSPQGLTGGTVLPASLATDSVNLTGGDFNGDGRPDLAANGSEWGQISVMYGPFTRAGAPASHADLTSGRDYGPTALAAGDINGDGRDDLFSVHAFEEMSESSLYWKGGAGGLGSSPQLVEDAGSAAVGDIDHDGFADVVIRTVPKGIVEDLPYDHGTIKVLYGSTAGPGAVRTRTVDQNTAGVPGVNEDGDQFGYALAVGDVNGDGYGDVTVGIPGEDLHSTKDAGSVVQLYGRSGGLSTTGAQAFNQATAGVPGVAEAGDHFGRAVWLGDANGDGRADLAVGAPDEDGTYSDSGAAWVLRGQGAGLTTTGVVSFGPISLGAPEKGATLGSAFAR